MNRQKKPPWLTVRIKNSETFRHVEGLVHKYSLNTVCLEANCPNRMECYDCGTATFLILGSICTRNCTFCNVTKGRALPVDPEEPTHIAEVVRALALDYVVITSVTRDDLPDGGAAHFHSVVEAIHEIDPNVRVELLIPDFRGDRQAVETVAHSGAVVINHNIETVPSLYSNVRPLADYRQSLDVIKTAKASNPRMITKSGLMVGLGESKEEMLHVLTDLRDVDCDLLTIGQYLAPSEHHHPVVEYVHPDVFDEYRGEALRMGFTGVASGPFVRSSYRAAELAEQAAGR